MKTPMIRPKLPALRWPTPSWNGASVAAISFSLTFVAVSIAMMFGLLPSTAPIFHASLDAGVVLLLAPLCALCAAILVEVLRAALRGLPRVRDPIDAPALSGWRPGQGEG